MLLQAIRRCTQRGKKHGVVGHHGHIIREGCAAPVFVLAGAAVCAECHRPVVLWLQEASRHIVKSTKCPSSGGRQTAANARPKHKAPHTPATSHNLKAQCKQQIGVNEAGKTLPFHRTQWWRPSFKAYKQSKTQVHYEPLKTCPWGNACLLNASTRACRPQASGTLTSPAHPCSSRVHPKGCIA